MKKILFALLLFIISNNLSAQSIKGPVIDTKAASFQPLKIVFQLSTADTLIHQTFMSQLKNYFSVSSELKVEVVCHGGGINFLLKESSVVQEQIKLFSQKGVKFVACEFTMAKRKITKNQLVAEAGTVTSGVLEIARKQQEGWSYIKL